MKNNTKILIASIVILLLIASVSLYLNKDNAAKNKALNDNAIFKVLENGNEIASYTMTEIQAIGEKQFIATLDTSTTEPEDYEYTGVLLKDIFIEAGISLENRQAVIVTAADGYSVAVDMSKFLEEDNVFLAYRVNGELLGTKEEGGKGPYQMIISKDPFSQFWCKFALSADIQ
ncbi:MAG: molybdopterin-dependent oxidoreductase [Tissierellales bacterium]|nr:molybdopterin-dependent oxidoreductase [Tissierellales bacterium]MBN2828255.1 molybdopterin-dependent oxidoreductase [Tissierellales bacterium]